MVYPHKTAANHKISQNYFEKIRAFNAQAVEDIPNQIARSSNIFDELGLLSEKPYGFFKPKQRMAFLDQFKKSNNQLAQRYFPNNQLLFSQDMKETMPIIDQTTLPKLTTAEINDFSQRFYKKR